MYQRTSLLLVFIFSSAIVFIIVCCQPTTYDKNDISEVDHYDQLVNNNHFKQLVNTVITFQTKLSKLAAKNEKLEIELANRKYLYDHIILKKTYTFGFM